MKLKLYRDKVISIVRGKELVGVYVKMTENASHGWNGKGRTTSNEILLAEMSPKKADKIISLWNSK